GRTAIYAFIIVALSEELAKFIFLRGYLFGKPDFNEPFDGIVYAVMVGMGFAAFENVVYVAQGGFEVGVLRMFTAVPAHASFGIIMGYYVGRAKFDTRNKNQLLAKGLFWAVFAHGAYDFFLMQERFEALGIMAFIVLIVSIQFSRQAIEIHQNASPFHPDNVNDNEFLVNNGESNFPTMDQEEDEKIG
ncbi:MAG: PrsW family intramembrane metalloprotease, partial [Chitinophagales bacterium]